MGLQRYGELMPLGGRLKADQLWTHVEIECRSSWLPLCTLHTARPLRFWDKSGVLEHRAGKLGQVLPSVCSQWGHDSVHLLRVLQLGHMVETRP